MKKFYFLLGLSFVIGAVLLSSCNGSKKLSPEDEVRNYGKYFVDKLAANQLDSLTSTYPDIVKADSLAPLWTDSIIVVESTPGNFDMTISQGVTLKVNLSDDGNITVTESKGLFAFPAKKVEVAMKTGMWNGELTDAQLSELMKDDAFFAYIQDKVKKSTSKILTVGEEVLSNDMMTLNTPIINNTDQPISGSDYKIIVTEYYPDYDTGMSLADMDWKSSTRSIQGKDIPPHGKYIFKADMVYMGRGGDHVKGVKITIPEEELASRFASFTGNEYQEYLNSKK